MLLSGRALAMSTQHPNVMVKVDSSKWAPKGYATCSGVGDTHYQRAGGTKPTTMRYWLY